MEIASGSEKDSLWKPGMGCFHYFQSLKILISRLINSKKHVPESLMLKLRF